MQIVLTVSQVDIKDLDIFTLPTCLACQILCSHSATGVFVLAFYFGQTNEEKLIIDFDFIYLGDKPHATNRDLRKCRSSDHLFLLSPLCPLS